MKYNIPETIETENYISYIGYVGSIHIHKSEIEENDELKEIIISNSSILQKIVKIIYLEERTGKEFFHTVIGAGR